MLPCRRAAAALMLLALAACAPRPPFAFFGMRVGMKAEVLEQQALRLHRPFECGALWDGARACQFEAGDQGQVEVLVDARGRVAHLAASWAWMPTGRQAPARRGDRGPGDWQVRFVAPLEKEWTRVAGAGTPDASFDPLGAYGTKWTAAQGRFSGTIVALARDSIPHLVVLADEPATAAILERNPALREAYAARGLAAAVSPREAARFRPPYHTLVGRVTEGANVVWKHDLERLVRAQEEFFAAHSRFAADTAELRGLWAPPFRVATRIAADSAGWAGAIGMDSAYECVVWVGAVATRPMTARQQRALTEGEVTCDRPE